MGGRREKKEEKKVEKKEATLAILLCSRSSSLWRLASLTLPFAMPLGAVGLQMSLKTKMLQQMDT